MAVIKELIRTEANGTISFGDYSLDAKAKLDNFEHDGDLYKVKTFREITKLERNGMFVYESVPGTAVRLPLGWKKKKIIRFPWKEFRQVR